MRANWIDAPACGMHPADNAMLAQNPGLFRNWTMNTALQNVATRLDRSCLHVGLHPQPFLGNVDTPLIYILHGNPGYDFRDYYDEFIHPTHGAACDRNLRTAELGFFPLGDLSAATGAHKYWSRAFQNVIAGLHVARGIDEAVARQLLQSNVGLVESCAYHSIGGPGAWADQLLSSLWAQAHAQVAFQRARQGDSLVIVWRKVDFWNTGPAHPNIHIRGRYQRQTPTILTEESDAIIAFLENRA